jgi:hypothetical protein
MRSSKSRTTLLCTVLLFGLLNCGQTGYCDIEKRAGKLGPEDRKSPQARPVDAEFFYALLRQNGVIKHPKLNYEIYVKRVQGRKLLEVAFLRKNPKTQNYDVMARAREAELHVQMKTRQVLVHLRFCWISSSDPDIVNGFVEDKIWPVELPEKIFAP